jgi:hypothetical protein
MNAILVVFMQPVQNQEHDNQKNHSKHNKNIHRNILMLRYTQKSKPWSNGIQNIRSMYREWIAMQ